MKKENKVKVIAQLGEVLKEYPHFYLVDVTAMNAAATSAMRAKCFKQDIKMLVVKNTLLGLAAKNVGLDDMCGVLEGTTAIAISPEDHTAAARILSKFADTHKNFSVKSGYLDGKVVDTATIDSLAKLPTREILLATVCNAFNAPISAFARAVQAIVDKGGEATAEAAAE